MVCRVAIALFVLLGSGACTRHVPNVDPPPVRVMPTASVAKHDVIDRHVAPKHEDALRMLSNSQIVLADLSKDSHCDGFGPDGPTTLGQLVDGRGFDNMAATADTQSTECQLIKPAAFRCRTIFRNNSGDEMKEFFAAFDYEVIDGKIHASSLRCSLAG